MFSLFVVVFALVVFKRHFQGKCLFLYTVVQGQFLLDFDIVHGLLYV